MASYVRKSVFLGEFWAECVLKCWHEPQRVSHRRNCLLFLKNCWHLTFLRKKCVSIRSTWHSFCEKIDVWVNFPTIFFFTCSTCVISSIAGGATYHGSHVWFQITPKQKKQPIHRHTQKRTKTFPYRCHSVQLWEAQLAIVYMCMLKTHTKKKHQTHIYRHTPKRAETLSYRCR